MIETLDFDRASEDFSDREVVAGLGFIEPLVDEMDRFVRLPMRLVSDSCGLGIEIGPYSLTEDDIHRLRVALRTLDRITQ